jgi:hypothetical protein
MRRTRRNIWRTLKGMVIALATAAVVTGTAAAALPAGDMPQGYAPSIEAELAQMDGGRALLQAGLTFDYATTPSFNAGVERPDGYQPQLQHDATLIVREAPDGYQPQTKTTEIATVSANDSGFELGDAAVGFGLGLVLAMACGLALGLARGRMSTAQS